MTIDKQIPGLYINAKYIIGILADPLFKMTLLLLMEEILHELIRSLSHYLRGLIYPRWLADSST